MPAVTDRTGLLAYAHIAPSRRGTENHEKDKMQPELDGGLYRASASSIGCDSASYDPSHGACATSSFPGSTIS